MTLWCGKFLRGVRYRLEKKQGERADLTLGQFGPKCRTSERLAKEYGVSAKTIRRDAELAEAVDILSPGLPPAKGKSL